MILLEKSISNIRKQPSKWFDGFIGDLVNILKGRLNKKNMARFAGVETLSKVDESLDRLADQGYLKYEKIKGGYRFVLYPEPVKELSLSDEPK